MSKTMIQQSGNRGGLLRPSPLITVRASLPAYGSGTLKAKKLLFPPPAGKTGSVDHPAPERDIFGKPQNTKAFTWSTRIGPKWSGCPFFPLIPLNPSQLWETCF